MINRKKILTVAMIAMMTAPGALAGSCAAPGSASCGTACVSCMCGCESAAVPIAVQPVSVGQSMNGMAAEVVNEVNAERAKYGLKPLKVSAGLTGAAQVRAQEIAKKFSHTRPDGSSWSTVSESAFGENIARGHGSASRVMAAWMTSDGHRKNILRESFGSIGVYALKVNGVIHWVQLFGR